MNICRRKFILDLVTKENIKEYKDFLESHPESNFMQSIEWAAVKDNWVNEIIIIRNDNNQIKGALSILIRKVPFIKKTIMYAPRGPVCDIHDTETLSNLFQEAKKLAKKHKAYILKIDPDIKKEDKIFEKYIKEYGFKVQNESKNFEGIQPRFVFRLKIAGKTEEELLNSFHSKTRYNIRLAKRKGVEVKTGTRSDLKEFHNIMKETGVRDEFIIRNLEYFEKMYDSLAPDHLRLYLAYYKGKIIAGTIPIVYGDKCWYLYGASSNDHRNVMPNYLLQWEMIKWAIEKRCNIYDFRGVSGDLNEDNPLYGLYKFKKGFNGEFTEFIGELDLVFNKIIYIIVEKGEKLFREIRRIIRLKIKKEG